MKKVLAIGVTGGIACGKSEVGRILRQHGLAVREADEIAHELMQPGEPVHERVVEEFGSGILDAAGRIDRSVLGRVVFANPARRARLNELVHPAVKRVCEAWLRETREKGTPAAVIVPLLFEAGWDDMWDAVVCVTAPESAVRERLAARGLGPSDIAARIAAQMPAAEKARRSDVVIENDQGLKELEDKTTRALSALAKKER